MVEAVGGDVTSFRVGDRVFGYNEGRFGAHAEYLPVRAGGPIAVMPANRAYAAVAPGTEGAHYALGLIRKAKIGRGQTFWSTARPEPSDRRRSNC